MCLKDYGPENSFLNMYSQVLCKFFFSIGRESVHQIETLISVYRDELGEGLVVEKIHGIAYDRRCVLV